MALVTADESIFVVVDTQSAFIDDPGMNEAARSAASAAVERIAWLAGFAGMIDVPVVVVEEAPGRNGATDARVRERLPDGTAVREKDAFSLSGCGAAMEAIRGSSRQTLVVAGFETDVCVAQSAIELHELGFRVVAPEDMSYSTSAAEHRAGIVRMTHAGIEPNSFKGVVFEWLRTLARAEEFFGGACERLGDPPFRDA